MVWCYKFLSVTMVSRITNAIKVVLYFVERDEFHCNIHSLVTIIIGKLINKIQTWPVKFESL